MEYTRREYKIEGEQLEKQQLRMVVTAGNTILYDIRLQEPGMVALISRAAEQGIAMEIVSPGQVVVDSGGGLPATRWQLEALGE